MIWLSETGEGTDDWGLGVWDVGLGTGFEHGGFCTGGLVQRVLDWGVWDRGLGIESCGRMVGDGGGKGRRVMDGLLGTEGWGQKAGDEGL